jgi:predicted permease
MTESLLLAVLGGVGGWLIAAWVSPMIGLARDPLGWPRRFDVVLDVRVLLFCTGLSALTGLGFGLLPALQATRTDLVTALKTAGRGGSGIDRGFLRQTLLVAQVATCAVLLLCSGLALRSLQAARALDLGFENRNVLLLAFDPGLGRRPDEQSRILLRDVLDRVQTLPGVESATLTSAVPLTFIIDNSNFVPDGPEKARSGRVRTDIYTVGPLFFETFGIAVRSGEPLTTAAGSRRIAMVNDAFAQAAFGESSPIGRRILGDGKALDVVGIVATAKSRTIGEAPKPAIFLPILTEYTAGHARRGVTLAVKTSGAPLAHAEPLRQAIRAADPSLAVFDVRTLETHIADALLVPRLLWGVAATGGFIGLALAIVGMYGVISFAVTRRSRELGIRLAIGALPREVLMLVLRQGLTLAAVGTALGIVVALGLTRFAASLLYEVAPTDPVTFAIVPLIVLAVTAAACLVPARAAARLDPVDVLRSE